LRAVKDLKEAIDNGSFGRITESYKTMDVDLTEQVNQVRKFRNWVAHGRRDKRAISSVDPEGAIGRLRRYLARLEEVEKEEVEKAVTIVPPPVASEPETTPGPH
jgi:protein-arginine kinase activator protein McsA